MAGKVYSSPLIWPINFTAQFIAFGTVAVLVAALRSRLIAEESLSRSDSLTGMPNSRAFFERGELLLAVARRASRPITLAYLDLDNFKQINDGFGHQEGDRALTETATVLTRQLRSGTLAARLGGDEFAILLSDTGAEEARTTLERVREHVAATMKRNNWPVTVSVGAVAYARPPASLSEAVHDADSLMYRAKGSGKDQLHIERVEPPVHPASASDRAADPADGPGDAA